MYEMYPQTWAQESARPADAERPRRRPRRPHPVLPAVIARQLESAEPGRPSA
ncbi:hypothetical protein ACFFOM_19505 [Microlunatus capsulatus]|uniref:Transposase n=1 Tax=Microlunatus capsulatus TaxID=99117 RepID=A0ABS4ZCN6_9ACTN|nr:hypothetical protein [Microlunatus capsulatus]MBP2418802.1 hypothetical protein [Microlunatus capsulatus]